MLTEQLQRKEGFTETEKSIADYILNHGDEMLHITVRDLADACFTAPNTIMRLCRKLGFDGFRSFKVQLLKDMESSVYHDQLLDVNRPFYIGQSTSKIAHTLMKLQHQAIRDLVDDLNYDDLEKAAALLEKAHTIFVYGHGDSMLRVKSFMNKMFKINRLCILASEAYEEAGMSHNASPADAALFVSYRGGGASFESCHEILKSRKCPTIVLSAERDTKLTRECDVWIHIPDRENSADNIGTFYSQACFDYVLNLIYSLIYSSTYTKNHNYKSYIDKETARK